MDGDETENIQRNEQQLNVEDNDDDDDDDVVALTGQEEADRDSFQRRCLFDQTFYIATASKANPFWDITFRCVCKMAKLYWPVALK